MDHPPTNNTPPPDDSDESCPDTGSLRHSLGFDAVPVISPPQGHPVLAWLVILGSLGFLIWQANKPYTDPDATPNDSIDLQTEIVGRVIVGVTQSFSGDYSDLILEQADDLKNETKSLPKRLCYTVFVAEYKGPEDALTDLDDVEADEHFKPDASGSQTQPATRPESDQALIDALRQLYRHRVDLNNTSAPTDDQLNALKDRLGWFGKFAPLTNGTPEVDARRDFLAPQSSMLWVVAAVGLWYVLCGFAGFVLLIVFLVRTLMGLVQRRFAGGRGYGGIYAESFALYVLMWVVLRQLAYWIATPSNQMLLSIFIVLLTTSAVFWPLIRGVPWREMKQDLGLHWPKRPVLEPAYAFMTYMIGLPLMFMGALTMLALAAIQKRFTPNAPAPGHPVQETLMGAGWSTIVPVLILGVVVAPICEEIMFRGVLYRHLRDASNRLGTLASVVLSAVISSFAFAAIHPQGWVFIPVLMSLAFGFCIAREWRGTLMTSVLAHGLTNLVTLTLNIMLFSGG